MVSKTWLAFDGLTGAVILLASDPTARHAPTGSPPSSHAGPFPFNTVNGLGVFYFASIFYL